MQNDKAFLLTVITIVHGNLTIDNLHNRRYLNIGKKTKSFTTF